MLSAAPTPLSEPERGAPCERRGARWLSGIPVATPWLLGPVAVLLVDALLPAPSDLRARYQAAGLALVVAPALAWLLTRRGRLAHHTAAALTGCVLPLLTLIALHGTDWYFAGPTGDQSFRLEYVTRFASHLTSLTDYTYDVPAFYSPGWFWVVGAAAAVTGVAAWQAYTWVAVATTYLAVVLAFLLWRRSFGTRTSALLVTVTAIGLPAESLPWLGHDTLLLAGAYEPYGFLVALSLPALLTWWSTREAASWRRGVLLGVALAVAAWLYLLYAAVAVVAVLLLTGRRWRERQRWREVAVAGATSVVLVLPWLGSFLVHWVRAGRPRALATTYVAPGSFVRLVSPVASPWFLLAAVGAVAVVALRGPHGVRVRGCTALAVAVVVLAVVQVLVGQRGGGLLFERLLLVLGVTLLAAGTLAVLAVLPVLRARLGHLDGMLPARPLAAGVLGLSLLVALSAHAEEWVSQSQLRTPAFDTPYPDGRLPALAGAGARTAAAGQPSVEALAAAVRSVTAEAGRSPTTPVLTDDIPLLALTPLYGYQQWWELYASPLGRYSERRAYLESLAGRSSDDVVQALQRDADAPTVFVLRSDGGSVRYASLGWDPASGTSSSWSVALPADVFSRPAFVTRAVGGWTVAALRRG